MDLFGVQELPNSKSINAPGWAYVPDTGINPSVAALQPSSNKRAARKQPTTSGFENTAKQDAKILRDLAELDKDSQSHKDVQIPVPVRHRDNAGRVSHGQVTPAVRKILQSGKTFANHLSDAEALAALAATQPQPSMGPPPAPKLVAAPAPSPAAKTPGARGPYKKKTKVSTPLRQVSDASSASSTAIKPEPTVVNTPMIDAPPSLLNPLPTSQVLASHPGDRDPLLISHIPPVPPEEEMLALIAAPPLTYLEAKATLVEGDFKRPTRSFCQICGYWGRARCMKCGTRVCALECLRTHQEDCYTRYGA